jgi:spectinomycin phosphotransferase
MLEDPGLDHDQLAAELGDGFGIVATAFRFVPGYDQAAAAYEVIAADGRWFAKVRFGSFAEAPLEVPRALLDAGVTDVLAPVRTRNGGPYHPMAGHRGLVVYPFVAGHDAVETGLSHAQWRQFGHALRAVHESDLPERLAARLPTETFGLSSARAVREVLTVAQRPPVASAAGERLAAGLAARSDRILAIIERAQGLARELRHRTFDRVLCHADIHAANLLVADDGRVYLVDWDGPMLAPRERDLLFVIGSRIARDVLPHEEAWFFEGYGEVTVDRDAIVYYRYERILEDIGAIGDSVLRDPEFSEESRAAEVRIFEAFFESGGMLETVESA